MFQVVVVSGTRAEYGLLRPVLKKLARHPEVALRLVVTGAHLSAAHGGTVAEIEADGLPVFARLDILSAEVPPGRAGTAQRTAAALSAFLGCFLNMDPAPDAVLLLGDRYEMFAAGQAAALLNIPLAHVSGGDVTAGADDDWFRHCLSKMAKLHFPSCEAYRRRLIRMGEAPGRVFNVGGLGDENIRSLPLLPRRAWAQGLALPDEGPYALVTFHPETQSDVPAAKQADALLQALARFQTLFFLFTGANADAGGDAVNAAIAAFCAARENAQLVPSLGVLRYLSAMKGAAAVVGNSSSGVTEASSLGVPAVDIGRRQEGRVAGANVLRCALAADEIEKALQTALSATFAQQAKAAKSPYDGGDTSGKIVDTLLGFLHSGALCAPKVFYDGEAGQCGC